MADNVYYDMGQIRYKAVAETGEHSYENDNGYVKNLNFHSYPVTILSGQTKYRDIILIPDNPSPPPDFPSEDLGKKYFKFENGVSYHLDLDIPTNLSYDMIFDIKLVKVALDEHKVSIKDPTQYQEVRQIVVSKDKRNIKTYSDVILYLSPNTPETGKSFADSRPVACVVYNKEKISENDIYGAEKGEVYYDEGSSKYMIKGGDGIPDQEIKNYNVVSMAHTWLTETSTEYEHFDIVFSKKVPDVNFNAILIQMQRDPVTNGIRFESAGEEYNGLHVKTEYLENKINESWEYKGPDPIIQQQCNQIINLVPDSLTFNNIGVWSHPDSILAINGEEIRIGQSGYYELNDFDITNFGIIVKTPKDKFSLDYQYQIPE